MPLIKMTVRGQNLKQYNSVVLVEDSSDLLKMQFNFRSSDWAAVAPKTINFIGVDETMPVKIAESNSCYVPKEVIKAPGFGVSVFGGDMATNVVTIPVVNNGTGVVDPNITVDMFNELANKVDKLDKTKADNIIYNAEENYIQLVANDIPIGNKITISTNIDCITELEINEDGYLIAYHADGTTANIGAVNGVGGIYVPRFEYDKLIFELKDAPGDEQVIYDLDRTNEWSTPEDANATNYIWETLC
jgi:hypothetical protein